MSLAALGTVLFHIALFGIAPQPDEGASAHIWQLLMAGQVPVVIFFAAKWLPQSPKPTLVMFVVQFAAACAAAAPVYWLGW
jgi:hypothetical protein